MKLEIELKICGLADFLSLGTEILRRLNSIEQQQEKLMAQSTEMTALIAKLNTATNILATRLAKLEAKIKDAGMSAADEAAAIAELSAIGTTLEGMGADPADPLPPPEPTPVP